eukprot:COSAG05_NODE_21662_length_270_cov_0.608187_1_plen_37_part_10
MLGECGHTDSVVVAAEAHLPSDIETQHIHSCTCTPQF